MNFIEAVQAMKKGKRLSCERWIWHMDEDQYIVDDAGKRLDQFGWPTTSNWELVGEKKTLSDKALRAGPNAILFKRTYYEDDIKASLKEFLCKLKWGFSEEKMANIECSAKETFGDRLV